MKTKFALIFNWIFDPVINISMSIRNKVKKNIRLELILIFAICLLVAILIGGLSNKLLELNHEHIKANYSQDIKVIDGKKYIVMSGDHNTKYAYDHDVDTKLPAVIISFLAFIIMFYFITNRKMKYIEIVSIGLLEISKGNLNYRIKKYGED